MFGLTVENSNDEYWSVSEYLIWLIKAIYWVSVNNLKNKEKN